MYVCATGHRAKKTTLEKTKQWFLFVPTARPVVAAKVDSYANRVLLAAQADAVNTRARKVSVQKKASRGRMVKRIRKRALERRRIKTVMGGTFYIIPYVRPSVPPGLLYVATHFMIQSV